MKLLQLYRIIHIIASISLLPSLACAWTNGLKEAAEAVAKGTALPEQEMMVFINNSEVNLLAQEGKISDFTYASCQDDFFRLNESFADKAVRELGYDPSISNRKFNPGTDTDVNVNARGGKKLTLEDMKKIDDNYQKIVKQHFKSQGLEPPTGRINTETDFMPNPAHTDPAEFQKIVKYINDNGGTAYTDPKAASAQFKLGTTQPMGIDEAASFSSTMKEMADAKIRKANNLRKNAAAIRTTDPGKAEAFEAQARQYDYQASKYHDRIDKLNTHLREQYHLSPPDQTGKGFTKAVKNIDTIGRNPFTAKDASVVNNLHKNALQRSADDMIDTLLEIARKDPAKAGEISRALAQELNSLPPNRAGQAVSRIDDAMKAANPAFAKNVVAEAKAIKQVAAASKWTSFKSGVKNISGINQLSKVSVIMTAGGAVLMAHQGITITLDNVKATDTLWDYFRNCYYHSAWEGTGIGPAFEQAEREEIERYLKEHEAGQDPSMVKHVTLTLLKTSTYMGRDAIVGVLYLPDAIWEYFTEEKAMEGYAKMQNELAAIMRQIVLDRQAFDRVMTDMRKIGLHDSDALPFLNCLCRDCGGSLGGLFNPECTSDIGHGPCQCNGPLTIWKTPLPAGDKEAQYRCFNSVTQMRYNEARAVFDSWTRQLEVENAKSVQGDLESIKADIVAGKAKDDEAVAKDIANQFGAIKDLLLPGDADYVRAMVGPYLENHAVNRLQEGKVDQALKNLDLVLETMGPRSFQEAGRLRQKKAQYQQWKTNWDEKKKKTFPEISENIRTNQLQRARGEIENLEFLMLKAPNSALPPAIHDPAFVSLKERVAALGKKYTETLAATWEKVRSLEKARDRRAAIVVLEKSLKDWEHHQNNKDSLTRQLSYNKSEVQKAEQKKTLGQKYQETGSIDLAIEQYTASLAIQSDASLEETLAGLQKTLEQTANLKNRARGIWNEAEQMQREQKYGDALQKYKAGLAIFKDPVILDRAKKLEKYIELTKASKAQGKPVAKETGTKVVTAPKASPKTVSKSSPAPAKTTSGSVHAVKDVYQAGELIEISYDNLPGNRQDWITLIQKDKPDNTYAEWFYTDGKTSGRHTFKALPAGEYEIRTYHDWPKGGYVVQQRRNLVVVENTPPKAIAKSDVASLIGEWAIVGNGHRGRMLVSEQNGASFSGRVYPDQPPHDSSIKGQISGSMVSFARTGWKNQSPDLRQDFTGTITRSDDGKVTITGTFTQNNQGSYQWTATQIAPVTVASPSPAVQSASPSTNKTSPAPPEQESAAQGWQSITLGNVSFALPSSWKHRTMEEPEVELLHIYWEGDFDSPVHGLSGGIALDWQKSKAEMSGSRPVELSGTTVSWVDDGPAINLLFPAMAGNRGVALIIFRGQGGTTETIDAILKTFRMNGSQ
ncbi:tropomyosin [Desulfopila aestuarii]|uniref:Tetratricopeptide repeat-containing protein n=1 Tax=Desulfopila aestuarii DSM 18488 TaxID=1121416 RepID=A0A1M7YFG1_9BACT|nr:hypothetical protein [Desulfopila aestuarii]SHO51360.1 hypothetical protein SAMN02745220_03977 [Desulfopila aestuarii DSM 18488]